MVFKNHWSGGLGAVLDMLKKHGQDSDLSWTFIYDITVICGTFLGLLTIRFTFIFKNFVTNYCISEVFEIQHGKQKQEKS